jgi:hypothetical protein
MLRNRKILENAAPDVEISCRLHHTKTDNMRSACIDFLIVRPRNSSEEIDGGVIVRLISARN